MNKRFNFQDLIRCGNVVQLEVALKTANVGVATCIGRDSYSLLHWACHYGTLEVQKLMHIKCFDIESDCKLVGCTVVVAAWSRYC